MKRLFTILIGLVLAGFVFSASIAKAEGGMQISPVTFNFQVNPGETDSGQITLKNLNTETINYSIDVELFNKVSDEGAPSFEQTLPQEGVTTLSDWITYTPKEGTIEPQQSVTIDFTISIPQGAEPGGHYAAVFAKQLNKTPDGKTQLGVTTRVGSLVLVSVPGDVKKSVSLKDFLISKFVWRGPVSMSAKVQNTGSVHYDSQVKVALKPLFGASSEVDLGKHTVIPKNERNFEGSWGKKYPFGYYKLTASASDGDGKFSSTSETSVFALPLIIVIPLLAVILIILLVTKYVKKNFKLVKARPTHED